MKRRNFIGASGALAVTAAIPGCSGALNTRPMSGEEKKQNGMKITTIAGFPVQELLKKYQAYLFDDFLPFMDKHIIDHESGGFMCNADRSGNLLTTNKRTWFDGRGLWVYSFLYNNLRKDPAFLDTARKTAELLLKIQPRDNEFWPWSYTRDGKPINESPPDIYGNLFVAEGLAEYSKACGEDIYYDIAKKILLSCLNIYDRLNYVYDVYYGPSAEQLTGPRVLGHWMVFLKASNGMLHIHDDPEVSKVAERSIDALMNYHYMSDFDLMIEVLTHDLKRPDGPFSQFSYTGHAIEVLWMIMDEALRRKDRTVYDLAAKRLKRHVEVAWDDVYGGVFRCLENVDQNIWQVDKVLWEQEEVLIGSMSLIEHTADPWAFRWFDRTYNYVMDNFPLQKYGYSLWNAGGDRKMTFVKEADRVENYHHPRHLMLNILSMQRVIKAGNKASFPEIKV